MVIMIVRDKDNVSVIFVMMGLRNLVRVDVNNSLFIADRQFVTIMAKPMKRDSIKVYHTITAITIYDGAKNFI
jgi:hypothetical protein